MLHKQLLKLVVERVVDLECSIRIWSITEPLGRIIGLEIPGQVI